MKGYYSFGNSGMTFSGVPRNYGDWCQSVCEGDTDGAWHGLTGREILAALEQL